MHVARDKSARAVLIFFTNHWLNSMARLCNKWEFYFARGSFVVHNSCAADGKKARVLLVNFFLTDLRAFTADVMK